ncbi:MAG: AAA family ATPase [Aquamicrobium sp.]|uniref:AAA family ATPase n=1 Tax=Aquamicrobium sp. TaxID=1872579 RepID=UPI00349E4A2A|nr:AAA family ATPase [Aquamicrobium sp.]
MIAANEAAPLLEKARRILVIGCSGSGKSTLAQALAARLGSPYISMDREFFWLPGWILRERGEVRRLIAEAVAGERWVMDGTSPGTLDLRLPRADMVIWLRMPRLLCIARVVRRRILHSGRSRPEMAPGCPEKIDYEFLHYIWNFERTETPEIHAALARHGPDVPVVTLSSPAEVRDLLARLDAAL